MLGQSHCNEKKNKDQRQEKRCVQKVGEAEENQARGIKKFKIKNENGLKLRKPMKRWIFCGEYSSLGLIIMIILLIIIIVGRSTPVKQTWFRVGLQKSGTWNLLSRLLKKRLSYENWCIQLNLGLGWLSPKSWKIIQLFAQPVQQLPNWLFPECGCLDIILICWRKNLSNNNWMSLKIKK